MSGNSVGWFEIYVEDMNRAKKFYESVFDEKLTRIPNPEPEMWAFSSDFSVYGAAGALVHMPGFPVGKNSVIVYFSCEDCAVEEKKALQFGGRLQKTKFSIGQFGFISLVHDTEGNMIGLHSQK